MPSRATGSVIAHRFARLWRHTRCADPEVRTGTRLRRAPHLPSPGSRPDSWQTPPVRLPVVQVTRASTTLRQTLVLLRIAASDTRKSTQGVRATHSVNTKALAFARACKHRKTADALGPFERIEIVLGGEQRGRVDGCAFEQLLDPVCLFWSCGRSWAAAEAARNFPIELRHAATAPTCREPPPRPALSARKRSPRRISATRWAERRPRWSHR